MSEIRDVEVHPSIIIEITGRDSHAVAAGVDATCLSDVRKLQGAGPVRIHEGVIAVQTTLNRSFGRNGRIRQRFAGSQHTPLHNKDVEIAVIVVVKQSGP